LDRAAVKKHAAGEVDEYKKNFAQAMEALENKLETDQGDTLIENGDGLSFLTLRDLGMGPIYVSIIIIGAVIAVWFILWLGTQAWLAIRFGDALALRRRSADVIRNLDFEVTKSREGGLEGSLFQRLGLKIGVKEQQKGRALTLPGLTARYVEYIRNVQKVLGKGSRYGSSKLIICIDELDKITDPIQVGNVLREIKGVLYEENCFYLLSISEDAVRAFEGRLVEQRDIFESTFDEIMVLERLDMGTCVTIARHRCKKAGYGPEDPDNPIVEEALEIAAILSTGVPREFLRNLRAVEAEADGIHEFNPSAAWHTLYGRKLREILKNIKTSTGLETLRADLIEEIGEHLSQCAKGYQAQDVASTLPQVRAKKEYLIERLKTEEEKFSQTALDTHVNLIAADIERLGAWIKFWTEMEIHLMVRQCGLKNGSNTSETRSEAYAGLLDIYAGLPYSVVSTSRKLLALCSVQTPVVAE
jgi:hypothetical protein